MKFIFVTLIIAVVLLNSSSAFKKNEMKTQVLHEFEKFHDLTKTCVAKSAAKCIGKVSFWDLNYLRKQVSKTYKNYKENQDDVKAFKKYLKKLQKDEKTGKFWKCTYDKISDCEDDEFMSLPKFEFTFMRITDFATHQQESDGEQCYETEGQKCYALVADNEDLQAKIQAQGQEMEEMDEAGAGPDEFAQKVDELTSDEETGEFWTCVFGIDDKCGEKDPVMDCYEENGQKCLEQVPEGGWEKIDAQGQELDELDEQGASEEDFQAKIEELKADEDTGAFWTCQFELTETCEAAGEEE